MQKPTNAPENLDFMVPGGPVDKLTASRAFMDLIDPDHAPHGVLDAMESINDGTATEILATAANEILGFIPADFRPGQ